MEHNYRELKRECFEANMEIPRRRLAIYTWGNVSVFDRDAGVFAIKPSGVSYDEMGADDIVIVDLEGKTVEGRLKPSSDTLTHMVLYNNFDKIGGVVHTHSPYAVGWAQALTPLVIYGTTHADHTVQDVPCTPPMSDDQIRKNYEEQTGWQIVNHFHRKQLNPHEVEMVLVGSHGPFTWGTTAAKAVYNAVVLEEIAKMALFTRLVNPDVDRLKKTLRDKHYERKHGPGAYYGQQ
ncbi:MAG: L-ribulose-5-phosphate 4-epimerase AraD [Spirochaetales bacterium]|nr:L-ribulose-5-phosphate 4-epimerase AraD [Spirochaetales bacterium]